ncbi:MAG: GxxExxY protein [Verrucomicrobia bacterium]|jgi:GxxExxY protein|nr:GxxExxY protein [Verrucomicrobiota bacterium]
MKEGNSTNQIDRIAKEVVDAAFKVHSSLGPGLLESAYEACLAHELTKRGYRVERQKAQPVIYEGLEIEVGYRIDLLVEDLIIIELKAVEQLAPIHQAQLLTYLKLSSKQLGFLMNFNVPLIKDGIRRIANQFQAH